MGGINLSTKSIKFQHQGNCRKKLLSTLPSLGVGGPKRTFGGIQLLTNEGIPLFSDLKSRSKVVDLGQTDPEVSVIDEYTATHMRDEAHEFRPNRHVNVDGKEGQAAALRRPV